MISSLALEKVALFVQVCRLCRTTSYKQEDNCSTYIPLIVFSEAKKHSLYMDDGRSKNLEVHLMIQGLLKEQVLILFLAGNIWTWGSARTEYNPLY